MYYLASLYSPTEQQLALSELYRRQCVSDSEAADMYWQQQLHCIAAEACPSVRPSIHPSMHPSIHESVQSVIQ